MGVRRARGCARRIFAIAGEGVHNTRLLDEHGLLCSAPVGAPTQLRPEFIKEVERYG